jgi:hypothetical protein
VARFRAFRRAGAVGIALTAWDIWRQIPKRHRRMIISQARKQAPRVAARVMQARRRRRER